jgi:hypothetical protein
VAKAGGDEDGVQSFERVCFNLSEELDVDCERLGNI